MDRDTLYRNWGQRHFVLKLGNAGKAISTYIKDAVAQQSCAQRLLSACMHSSSWLRACTALLGCVHGQRFLAAFMHSTSTLKFIVQKVAFGVTINQESNGGIRCSLATSSCVAWGRGKNYGQGYFKPWCV